jgi:hypothetical protein
METISCKVTRHPYTRAAGLAILLPRQPAVNRNAPPEIRDPARPHYKSLPPSSSLSALAPHPSTLAFRHSHFSVAFSPSTRYLQHIARPRRSP